MMAHHVGEPTGSRATSRRSTRSPIVGRDEELELLRAAIAAARLRQLQAVEIVAEPGIGKSRLVRELPDAGARLPAARRRGRPVRRHGPYSIWRDLLRPLAGITPDRSREEAGAQLSPWVQAVMPDLAPWLPLLAIPFDAERAARHPRWTRSTRLAAAIACTRPSRRSSSGC